MQVQAFAASDIGQARERNEDCFLVDKQLGLYIVCDGMGGHAAGEVASESAARSVADCFREQRGQIAHAGESPDGYFRVLQLAEQAVQRASSQLYELACAESRYAGMGTTLTLLNLVGNKGVMAHVGDSQLYLARDGKLHLLSTDHTLANELALSGVLSPAEKRESRYNHVLTRSLGPHDAVEVETLLFDLLPGDVFLLCSDGLSKYVEDEDEFAALLNEEVTEQSAQRLVELANRRGGSDNITAIIIEVQAGDDDDELAWADHNELQACLDVMQSVFLFRGLSLSRLMRVLNIAAQRRFDAGDKVLRKGEKCSGMHIVLSGQISYRGEHFTTGDAFGASSLFIAEELRADVVADSPTRLLSIAGADFRSLTRRFPKLGRRLLSHLAKRLSMDLQEANRYFDRRSQADTWPG